MHFLIAGGGSVRGEDLTWCSQDSIEKHNFKYPVSQKGEV